MVEDGFQLCVQALREGQARVIQYFQLSMSVSPVTKHPNNKVKTISPGLRFPQFCSTITLSNTTALLLPCRGNFYFTASTSHELF